MNKLNHYSTIVFGVCLIAYEINCMFTGKTFGLAASGLSREITSERNPIYFWVSVSVALIVGCLLVWDGIERLNGAAREAKKKPWEIEIK